MFVSCLVPLSALHLSMQFKSGGMGIRTPDIQLAKLALYQLSYTPKRFVLQVESGEGLALRERMVKTILCPARLMVLIRRTIRFCQALLR